VARPRLSAGLRAVVLVVGCIAVCVAAWRLAGPAATALVGPVLRLGPGGLDTVPFDAALLGLCALVLLGCVGWLGLSAALALAAYAAHQLAPGSERAVALGTVLERACPAVVGRVVLGALGIAVTAGVAGPALAAPALPDGGHIAARALAAATRPSGDEHAAGPAHRPGRVPQGLQGAGLLSGLALPDLPVGSAPVRARAATPAEARAGAPAAAPGGGSRRTTALPTPALPTPALPTTALPTPGSPDGGPRPVTGLVVRPGQSLWSIAAQLLPPSATDAQITGAWHRLHHANLSRIGSDPDLILPGTHLAVPDLAPDLSAPPRGEEAP
jgi:hypothetical protein